MRKEVFAWGMYDLANTAFSALFVTFFFPLLIKSMGGTEFQIGLVFGISMFLVGLFVPAIGAFSDQIGKRLPFIIIFTIVCAVFTWLTGYAGLSLALLFGLLANFFYHAALTTYNALLPSVAKKHEIGFASGIGVGMGYIGTLLSLGMAALILQKYGWESPEAIKLMFPATAIFFVIGSLWTFFGIREKGIVDGNHIFCKIHNSFKEVWHTLKTMRSHKGMISFLLASFMYIDAINAIIVFLYLYGKTKIGLSIPDFMIVYVIFSLAAITGSLLFGKLIDSIGSKRILTIAGLMWLVVIGILLKTANYATFLTAGILGGIALGTVWTAIRPLLISLSPKKKVGQFFGFSELADKFSGVLGPIVFGFLATKYSYTAGLYSLIIFFVAGLILLQNVPRR